MTSNLRSDISAVLAVRCRTVSQLHSSPSPLGAVVRRVASVSEEPSPEEARCFEIFRRVMGQRVEPYDHSGRQGAVDGIVTYADGRTAAVEVTSTGPAVRRQLEALLAADRFRWPCRCTWRWTLSIDDPKEIPKAKAVLQEVVDACEAAGVSRPHQLSYEVLDVDADLQWAADSSVLFNGSSMLGPNVAPDGSTFAWVHPGSIGGFPGEDGFATLGAELGTVLTTEPVSKRVEKVSGAEADERHLMVGVNLTAFSFPVISALMDEDTQPSSPPTGLPDAVTHLWLIPQYGKRVLVFADDGWTSHEVFD